MKIEKKAWPELFRLIKQGKKKFDVRLADFRCKPGDILFLREWNPRTKAYTGRTLKKKVSYVLKTKSLKFWSKKDISKHGLQVLSLE